jgi:hypothetical protein
MLNKTKKITFSNDFHNTQCTVIGKLASNQRGYIISLDQLKKVKRNLCGMSNCGCGSIRGQQDGFKFEYHDDFVYVYGIQVD